MKKESQSTAIGNLIATLFFMTICFVGITGFQKPKTYCIKMGLPIICGSIDKTLSPMGEFHTYVYNPGLNADDFMRDSLVGIIKKVQLSTNSKQAIEIPLKNTNYKGIITVFNAMMICDISEARDCCSSIYIFPRSKPYESNFMGHTLINDTERYSKDDY